MSEHTIDNQVFQQARVFITEGRLEEALTILEEIQAADLPQRREVAYLRAWCYIQREQWDKAARILFSADTDEEFVSDIQSLGQTERRRRASYLLLLGNTAVDLGRYEEATRHYTRCIKFLDERRMNITNVRIKARCGLGFAYTQTGFYTVALTHYEDALRLCGEDTTRADLPEIYAGLCDIHRHLGHFAPALEYGKQALQLSLARADKPLEMRMYTALGHICSQTRDFRAAASYYTEALTLAISASSPVTILNIFTALADVRLEEGLLQEARHYCEQALAYVGSVQDDRCQGMFYLVYGKVTEAEANEFGSKPAGNLLREALSWYQKAETALSTIRAAGAELAEVYGRLAQLLETSGQQAQAITLLEIGLLRLFQTRGLFSVVKSAREQQSPFLARLLCF